MVSEVAELLLHSLVQLGFVGLEAKAVIGELATRLSHPRRGPRRDDASAT
ncbi:MAG TPA: hypothetical protein VNH38_01245 [Candidatus Dormibacteraeota bacterium]|nr:hypothetical protein [Candidatus Dormibacteraeota bacterium]